MAKKKEAALTQELTERLSRDAYCFNLEHETEIERLKAEIERLKSELSSKLAAYDQEKKDTSMKANGEILDLKDEIERLKESNSSLGALVVDLEKKVSSSEEEAFRKFRKENRCFDHKHLLAANKTGYSVNYFELASFCAVLSKMPENDGAFSVFIPDVLEPIFRAVREAIDEKKAQAKGMMLQNKPKPPFPPDIFGGRR